MNRSAPSWRKHGLTIEALEDRRLLTVTWTGGGGDSAWDDANNWSTLAVPTSTDDVTIGSTGSPTVTIDTNDDAHSISVGSGATLSISAGGLNVSANSTIGGTFTMTGGSLNASGTGVTLEVDGTTTISDASFEAQSGATISLPQLTSYNVSSGSLNFEAIETGSAIDLANLSSISGTSTNPIAFAALSGGQIGLGSLATSSATNLRFTANGTAAQIDLSSATSLTGAGDQLNFTSGGSILTPNLTTFDSGSISVDTASASFPDLTNIDNSSVTVSDGSSLTLSGVTSYTNSTIGVPLLQANGVGSTLTFTHLSSLSAGSGVEFYADSGGAIDLPALQTYSGGNADFYASSSGSSINLSALTSLSGGGNQIHISQGGISAPNLATFSDGNFTLDAVTANYPSLTDIDDTSITLDQGSHLTLAGVTSVNEDVSSQPGWNVYATGTVLSLPNVTAIHGVYVSILANTGGQINLPSVIDLSQSAVVSASGPGAMIDFDALVNVTGAQERWTESNGGNIAAPKLAQFDDGSLTVQGATAAFPSLSTINSLNINVSNYVSISGILILPVVTSYTSDDSFLRGSAAWQVGGAGSLLSLPNLTTIRPNSTDSMTLYATSGGDLELAGLLAVSGAYLSLNPSGAGSLIDMPALISDTSGNNYVQESSGGSISIPDLDLLQNFQIQTDSTASFTLLPNQTFLNNGNTGNIFTGTLYDEGSLAVANSNNNMTLGGSLAVNGLGALSVSASGMLSISGNLLGNTTNADDFNPLGTVELADSSSTAANPQLLEAMSADDGAVTSGFVNNFAYGTLNIFPGYVQLVDQSHNSSGTGAEAVYADELHVASNATLDLNGLHLYTHAAEISGNVIDGTVTVLPPGGTLPLNLPTAGTLSTAGETDAWTFYGRAGQLVTVLLNPDGGASPVALNPPVDLGQVTLLDPNGTVIASTASSSLGAVATLNSLSLPADGTYTIHVQAPTNESNYTGDYVLTADVVTPNVRALTVDQPYTSSIANPLSVDQWTFSGSAGESVDLHLLGVNTLNVNYTLTGPGDTAVFSGLQADSGLVDLPASGNYVLSVQSSAGNTGGYSFELEQTSVVALSLGATYPGTLTGSGYAQLFTVNVPSNELLQVKLQDGSSTDVNELYVRHGAPPTRGTYDFSSTTAGSANQQVLVSAADPGTWYVLVYGNSVQAASNYTLQVSTTPISIAAVTPNKSAAGSTATLVLAGGGFDNTATVQLLGAGNTVYNAGSVSLDTFTQLSATFNLSGVPQGSYAVQVTRGDGSTAELPTAFTVTPPGVANLQTQLILPGVVGRHVASTFYVEYSNTGSVAMPAPVLLLESSLPEDVPLFTLNPALQTSGFWTSAIPQGYGNTVEILASGKVPGVLEPGESVTVPVYYGGMEQPWNLESTFKFDLRVFTPSDSDPVDWSSLQSSLQPPSLSAAAWGSIYGNLTSQLRTTWGSYVQMLDTQAAYLGSLGEDISDISQLWQFAVLQADNALLPSAQLDSATDISLATAGALSLDFSREYLAPIASRQTLGPLGYGWTDDWQYSLATASDGTLTVTMPGGAQRIFQPDSRGGDYFDQPGDYGVLTNIGGGVYSLRETNGQIELFNTDGTLNYIQDTNGNRITAGYTGGQLSSLTASSGGSLTIAYNSAGLIQSVASSDGRTVTYTYDSSDQLIQVQNYDGETTGYGYDTSGNPVAAHALTSIQFPDGTHQFYTYDGQGRLAGSSQDGGADPITYSYNLGQVTATDAAGDAAQFFYNEQGLPVKTIDPLGNVSFATYDGNFNLTSATGATGLVQNFAYDKNGNLTAATNPLGQTNSFSYIGPDNLLASSSDAQGNTTTYHYDSSGDLTSTQNPDGSVSSATYDALGDPLTIVNANGQVTGNTYNAQGQLTGETLADGTAYTFTYDAHGNLSTAVSAAGTITLSYDSGDRLTKVAYPNGQSLTYTYDTGGRRIQMVDQAGNTVNYSYTATGQLAGLTDGHGVPIITYSYNNLGQLIGAVDGNAGGPYTTYQYDADGDLLHLINYASGTTVNSRFDYTYNSLGQTATMATLDGTWTYSYDASGQLIHAAFASTNGAIPSQDLTYVYNAAGDRTQTIVNGITSTYTSNSVNEYTTVTSPDGTTTDIYDADGNLVSKTDPSGTTTYTYDSLDRLTSVTSPTDSWIYQYDALGNLASTTHDGQVAQNLNDPTGLGNVVGQYTGTGSLIASYTYGLGLVSQNTPGGTNYYQFDALGSTADLTNAAGTIQNSYSYLPFGSLLHSTGSAANPFTFVGQFGVSSDGSGLLNMRARSYDPVVGQFISNDPLGLAGGDTNVRRYATNNPVNFIDPTGRDDDDFVSPPPYVPTSNLHPDEPTVAPGDDAFAESLFGGGINAAAIANQTRSTASLQPINYEYEEILYRIRVAKWERKVAKAEASDRLAPGNPWNAILNIPSNHEAAWPEIANWLGLPKPPGGQTGGKGGSAAADSADPNGLLGPAGYGPQAFVAPGTVLPYEIDFENSPTATAPAQQVTLSDLLDPYLDPSTFQLTEIAFGDTVLTIPAGTQHYETTVSMNYNGQTFDVDVTAGINLTTDTVYATFISVDPNTGLPPDVLTGFLPPEDGTGRGMGKIDYTIQAIGELATGTQIRNVAQINFDENGIITTDQVDDEDPSQGFDPTKQALITIDSGTPTSSVAPLPATETSATFTVSWSGVDDAGGSGIAAFNIYDSDDGGPLSPWLTGTTLTSDTFSGHSGHTYAFYSQAIDNVGNVEAAHTMADTSTLVELTENTSTAVVSDHPSGSTYGQTVQFTATVSAGTGTPTGSVQFKIDGVDAGAPEILNGGTASFSTSALTAVDHTITAVYTSDNPSFDSTQGQADENVSPAPLTVTASSPSKVYGAALPALTFTTSVMVNGDTIATALTGSLSTTATASSPVAGYPISQGTLSAANYTITFVPGTLNVTPAPLTVTANNPNKVYGAALPALTFSAGTFVNGDTIATALTGALSTAATGSSPVAGYPISQGTLSAANYTITFVPGTLNVTPAPLTVTANNPNKVYGAALPALTYTTSAFVNGDTATTALTGALSTTATGSSPVAGYPISQGTLSAANYTITFFPGTLNVTPAPLTVTAGSPSKVYGAALPALTFSAGTFVNGDTAATALTGSLSTTATASSPVASYPISQGTLSAANYTITFVPGTLQVTAAPLTLTANSPSKVYGAALPALTFSAGTFVNGDTIATALTGALSTTATASSPVAGYPITQGTLSAANYTITFVPGTLNVTPAPLTVTAGSPSKVYGAALPALTFTTSVFVNGDTAATALTGALSTTAAASSPVTNYPISQGTLSAANYTVTFVPGTLSVTPAPLTLTAVNKAKTVGAANPPLTFSATGFVNGDTVSSLTTQPTLSTTATTSSPVGSYPISLGGAVDGDYTISYLGGTLTVAPPQSPTSKVNSLAQRQSTLTFPVSVTGSEPSTGSVPSPGLSSYGIYVATNGSAFTLWTTVPAGNPTAIFTGVSNTTYAFHSIAHDNAGNVETKSATLIEASTYIGDVTPPTTQITSDTADAAGTFTIHYSGTAAPGSTIQYFNLSVQVDGGAVQQIGQFNASAPVAGVYSGHASYQGLADGSQHTYLFTIEGVNGSGVQETAHAAPLVTATFATPAVPQGTAFSVERGTAERSYIRYIDLTFNEPLSSLTIDAAHVTLTHYNLDGTLNAGNGVTKLGVESLSGVTFSELTDHVMEIDFGPGGIGGSENLANTLANWAALTSADGYYKLTIDPDGTGQHDITETFYRLFGDVIGTGGAAATSSAVGIVTAADVTAVSNAVGQTGQNLNADINGAGSVTTNDRALAAKSVGRRLVAGLTLND